MKICEKLVTQGIILRYTTTIISFIVLSKNLNNPFINKYLLLILPILLTLFDLLDTLFIIFYKIESKFCTKFYYQLRDKINDLISYLLLFLFFKLDNYLLFFILYRMIGVILFSVYKNSKFLIFFFDFAKEYLLYLYIFSNNYKYLPLFIICKICYEYIFHNVVKSTDYNKKNMEYYKNNIKKY